MSSILTALLWKEWHEQKWRLASLTAVVLAIPLTMWWRDPSFAVDTTLFMLGAHVVVGGMFIGMGVAAGERVRGTERLTLAMPVSARVAMAVKLAVAAAVVVLPVVALVISMGIGSAITEAPYRHDGADVGAAQLLSYLLAAAGGAAQVLGWTVLTGQRRETELGAAISGAAVLLVFVILVALAENFERAFFGYESRIGFVLWIGLLSPAGLTIGFADDGRWLVPVACGSLAVILLLTAAIVHRAGGFGRASAAAEGQRPGGDGDTAVKRPFRSGPAALLWKTWREAAPLACLALLVFALLVVWGATETIATADSGRVEFRPEQLLDVAPETALLVGGVLALVSGIGLFTPDLQPRLAHFWRSRPITLASWFWVKWCVGLIILVCSIHGAVLLVAAVDSNGPKPGSIIAFLSTIPLLHVVAFAVAVLMACTIRQPVYAGILAFGLAMLPLSLPSIEPALAWLDVWQVQQEMREERSLRGVLGTWLNWPYARWLWVHVVLLAAMLAGARAAVNVNADSGGR